jgi:hypothetical protein
MSNWTFPGGPSSRRLVMCLACVSIFSGCNAHDSCISYQGDAVQKLSRIACAILQYQDEHRHLPPSYTSAKDGTPLHSWRVLILPQLGEEELFKSFRLSEPWNSEHNQALVARMPAIYRCLGQSTDDYTTIYQVFDGEGAAFEHPLTLSLEIDFDRRKRDTILVAESAGPVSWTTPKDMSYKADAPLPALKLGCDGRFRAGRLHGGVETWLGGVNEAEIRKMIRRR